MKVAVIGGAGFIGSYVVNELQKQGDIVQSYDGLMTNMNPEIDMLEHHKLFKARMSIFHSPNIKVDISSMNDLFNAVASFDPEIIINLAGMSSGRFITEVNGGISLATSSMISGLVNLLEVARIVKPQRFVQVSSSMVYGNYISVTEDSPCSPTNIYGALKYSSELLTKTYCKKYGIEYSIVRPIAVYGPLDNNSRVLGKFLTLAKRNQPIVLNTRDEVLDFTYVEDLAIGIIKAAKLLMAGNETFNMSYGTAFPLYEAATWIKQFTGSKSEITVKENSYYPIRGALNSNKAIEKLDFQPLIDPITGIKKYYDWHKNFFL